MAYEQSVPGYRLTDDPQPFDLQRAYDWIARQSYWGEGLTLASFARGVANSLTIGAYAANGTMAGMARVVTDRATFGWICDVFVDVDHRGAGLGKAIVAYLRAHPDLTGLRRLHLATRDAHGLYEAYGFAPLTGVEKWMEIRQAYGLDPQDR